jgi:hypothetical protein
MLGICFLSEVVESIVKDRGVRGEKGLNKLRLTGEQRLGKGKSQNLVIVEIEALWESIRCLI